VSTSGADHGQPVHRLAVAGVERLCEDAVAVTFAVPDDLRAAFAFRPGQHLTLLREIPGGEERRSYSICSPEGAAPRVGVRRVDGGMFSEWLVDRLQPGDELDVGTPAGSFSPEQLADVHLGMIAAGSGITPLLSIASTALSAHPASRVTLVYGNRRASTVMFTEELADLKDAFGPRLQLVHVLSREPTEVDLCSGRLDEERLRAILGSVVDVDDIDHWWLCGPLGVTEAATAVLGEVGVDRRAIHRELFYVEDEPPPAPARHGEPQLEAAAEATVTLHGRVTAVPVAAGATLLDAARQARGDVPFACKGGVCGTCRARVTEGDVTMRRNFALEDDEVAAGLVLTCQTRPRSERVAVDFDI
jgi:ring-1,2-phenylacetyl-CoA epoxidase subunit PaaE